MATPPADPIDSSQTPSSDTPYLTRATEALTIFRVINKKIEQGWNALTKQDYEKLLDGSLNHESTRHLKQCSGCGHGISGVIMGLIAAM
jgi:hypothetical protein